MINDKAESIINRIEIEPKSGKWKGRSKTGTSKVWYNEVTDWE